MGIYIFVLTLVIVVDCFTNSPRNCIFLIYYSSSGIGMKNSTNLEYIKENGDDET